MIFLFAQSKRAGRKCQNALLIWESGGVVQLHPRKMEPLPLSECDTSSVAYSVVGGRQSSCVFHLWFRPEVKGNWAQILVVGLYVQRRKNLVLWPHGTTESHDVATLGYLLKDGGSICWPLTWGVPAPVLWEEKRRRKHKHSFIPHSIKFNSGAQTDAPTPETLSCNYMTLRLTLNMYCLPILCVFLHATTIFKLLWSVAPCH